MKPRPLTGPVGPLDSSTTVPTSKSLTNRALIAAAAAGGGRVVRPLDCEDTRVLARALRTAGWELEWQGQIVIGDRRPPEPPVELFLADSGTGARLVIGLLAAVPGSATVDGSARLRERPMAPLLEALSRLGARVESARGSLPVRIAGRDLPGGTVQIRPRVSSQFVSALLLAGPLMSRGLELEIDGPLPSGPYLDLTEDVLRAFGSSPRVDAERRRWLVPGGGLRPATYTVEGDWSAAAFLLAAAAVAGGTVTVSPLDPASRQGDRAVVPILSAAGMDAVWRGDSLTVTGPVRRPLEADLIDTPDLFPALAAVASAAPPGSRFEGLENLVHKESDRLSVMVENLGRLGVRIDVLKTAVVFRSRLRQDRRQSRPVRSAGDHRIAMAMAVAALQAGPLHLDDGDCVKKSFPSFWQEWSLVLGSHGGRPP